MKITSVIYIFWICLFPVYVVAYDNNPTIMEEYYCNGDKVKIYCGDEVSLWEDGNDDPQRKGFSGPHRVHEYPARINRHGKFIALEYYGEKQDIKIVNNDEVYKKYSSYFCPKDNGISVLRYVFNRYDKGYKLLTANNSVWLDVNGTKEKGLILGFLVNIKKEVLVQILLDNHKKVLVMSARAIMPDS